ncbi:MAG: Gfo/Idh/MocA family protein [Planctomycetota bacterium]
MAVAGAGAWGTNHIRTLVSMRGVRLAWIIDPDPERRDAARRLAPDARTTADPAEAFADDRLDAVVIASPSPTHAPLARAALAASKHVLVEKPLAPDAGTAWDLVRRARRAQRLLAVGHLLLYHPAVRRLKRLVEEQRLGGIHYLYGQRTNLGRIRSDEGALTSLAPHDISVMVHLLGAWPTAVAARGAAYVQPHWEDVVFLTLYFPGGVLGHVHLSWLDPHKVRRLSLVGSRRMAVFDDMDAAARLRIHDKSAVAVEPDVVPARPPEIHRGGSRVVALPDREPLREELRAFLESARSGSPILTPGEDGARVVRVLEAAQRSLRAGGERIALRIRNAPAGRPVV